jgi:ATP-dependent DNA helicase RecG
MTISTTARTSNQTLALLPDANARAIAEHLVAFANTDGGTIVMGYDERGKPIGRVTPEDIEGALREAASMTRPMVRASLEQADASGGGPSLVVRVPRSTDLHSLLDGRVLIRMGVNNRPLTGDEIRNLATSKNSGDYETETVPGATLADLDDDVIAEYTSKRELRTRRVETRDRAALLREIGAIDMRGNPTVGGILLFGKNPQAFLPNSGIVFVKWPGTDARAEGGAMGYGRREEIGGPLARVIEKAWQVTFEEMRVGAIVKGPQREEVLEYPELAVREALVNAVCHRDYKLKGRRIEIRKFADRLEILSPGGLAGYITLDNIVEEHYSRNPRLVQGLFQWGYIEELGLGIDRMIEELTLAGHPQPKFEPKQNSFSVVMSNMRERRMTHNIVINAPVSTSVTLDAQSVDASAQPNQLTVNERQARMLQYLREHGRITNRDYQTLVPNVSPETLRMDLADLVDKGVLMRVGEKKGTYYILK